MKTLKLIVFTLILFISTSEMIAQRGRDGRHHRRGNKVVVVKRSPYRPAKIVVYHPHWRPNYAYNRRWVYFPKYNFYWDNWRNHYVFYNGGAWISQQTAPPILVNVNLQNEQNVELNEDQDDVDDVYQNNSQHKSQ